ncbi:hypothetical protein KIPB_000423 [Kipferlia bialata]|uniref:Uncharacterized protein n=1 Tax=Kipferlia bialata TaxID=797122 RepID=A0A9K3CP41_9EUKA|nr:hypothetical protein KIPB_000423 [Kipferlia bialata]|eukprot:g423.t1
MCVVASLAVQGLFSVVRWLLPLHTNCTGCHRVAGCRECKGGGSGCQVGQRAYGECGCKGGVGSGDIEDWGKGHID